jgi:YidC/Oxa1 family membrane protein insertase
MQQQNKNLLLFLVLAVLIYVAWTDLKSRLFPPPPKADDQGAAVTDKDKKEPKKDGKEGKEDKEAGQAPAEVVSIPPPPAVTPADKILTLGSRRPQDDSTFHLGVDLDPPRGGLRGVVLNKFRAEDPNYPGRPGWEDKEQTIPRLMELIPARANLASPSYLLYGYDVRDPDDDKPLDTLGRAVWKVVDAAHPVHEETLADGRRRQWVSFQAETQGVLITKTFSLTEREYHIGLEVKLRRKEGVQGDIRFRYQLTGAHGLPIEGRWYTSTFRNALTALVDEHRNAWRDFQDLRQISVWGGGNKVEREAGRPLRWAGPAVQYFAAITAVDDEQEKQDFLAAARPTLEMSLTKGQVVSVADDGSRLTLMTPDRHETVFHVLGDDRFLFRALQPGFRIAVLHHSASYNEKAKTYPQVAVAFRDEESTHALWEDDITVRVSTVPVDLRPGVEVVHKYLLYTGPVKVSQLYGQDVPQALVDRYHDRLRLDTLTDYHSPGAMGTFASTIGFSWLVIKCTNVMHAVLGMLHYAVPSYGLCIILLTVLVRGLMFPVSRKQQLMSFKMQKLAPELKKLQEKHKGDRQAMGVAQMELYRKHGVNPFGTCWFLLLQMPIFMGLYFALQESIHFRLAPFWPTWVPNLAAPDMMVRWGEKIPWLSRPADYGGLLYLGPYFNLLPVIAVILMIGQQKMLTPPPTDEQQALQMKIMRYMMIFFGLMFYKVAAGLCIYFIASSLWGFAERKLLPRFQPDAAAPPAPPEGFFQKLMARASRPADGITPAPATGVMPAGGITTTPAGDRGRRGKQRGKKRPERAEPAPADGWFRRLRAWWSDVLEQARKK